MPACGQRRSHLSDTRAVSSTTCVGHGLELALPLGMSREARLPMEESCMKLALLFAVAALIVACVKRIKRNSQDDGANSFHRFGL